VKRLPYTDPDGRMWLVGLPDDRPDSDVAMGIPLAPPSLDSLGLPEEISIRLQNELVMRRLFDVKDVRKRRIDVIAALQAALRVNCQMVVDLYEAAAPKPPERAVAKPPEPRAAPVRRRRVRR